MTDDVRYEDGPHGSLILSLDAVDRRNSIQPQTVSLLTQGLADEPARAVVLASRVPGIFSAGADLRIDAATRKGVSDSLYALYELIVTRPGVVIAVVDGPAVGGGAQLSAAADLRVVTPNARWRWVGAGHGLAVGSWILPDLVGRGRALDWMLSQRWIDPDEALAAGLATRLVSDASSAVAEMLGILASADPPAVARVKKISTVPSLIQGLRAERQTNDAAWSGQAPT